MNQSKIYEKRAHQYPVIVAMLIPLFLLIILSSKFLSEYNSLRYIWNVLITIIPAGIIITAVGFALKNVARSTSKLLFQFPIFKEDETQMPTTKFLLWSDKMISSQRKIQIREKIKHDLGLVLFDKEQENENPFEARILIVDAVRQIREKTRNNQILFRYNCNYGFMRNFLGANIWAFLISIIILIFNFYNKQIPNHIIIGSISIMCLSSVAAYVFLKQTAREYGRQLYIAYMEI